MQQWSISLIDLDALNRHPSDLPRHGSGNWTFIRRRDEVDCFVARIVGNPLTASRGVAVVDAHIAHVVGTFLDVDTSYRWMESLTIMSEVGSMRRSNAAASVGSQLQRQDDDDVIATEENNKSVAGKLSAFIRKISKRNRNPPQQQQQRSTLVPTGARGNGALNTQLVYQYFDLTWPLLDRDLLLRQETILYRPDKKVTDSTFISREHCCFV